MAGTDVRVDACLDDGLWGQWASEMDLGYGCDEIDCMMRLRANDI